MHYWLIKSEPGTFSLDDLRRVHREPWSGVRNYQARNFMWKDMRVGDAALFYHSNVNPPGIAGVAKVVSAAYPDPTQFDSNSEYYDPKASRENPRWWLVDFEYVAHFAMFVPLEMLKADPDLAKMVVCQRGTRLSITPVEGKHFKLACKLGGLKQ